MVFLLICVSFNFSCRKDSEAEDRYCNKLEDLNSIDFTNSFIQKEEKVEYVPFFDVEKGDSISKEIFRDKPFFGNDVTILYSTETDSIFRGEGGSSGPGYIFNLKTSVRTDNTAPIFFVEDGRYYFKIPIDLNEGAGGKWIYLYYTKQALNSELPLSMIQAIYSKYPILSSSPNFEKLGISFGSGGWTDLNEGAGGYYVYIEGIRTEQNYHNFGYNGYPIQDILIISSTSPMSSYPNWTFVPVDLNIGAGGKYIYLCYYQSKIIFK